MKRAILDALVFDWRDIYLLTGIVFGFVLYRISDGNWALILMMAVIAFLIGIPARRIRDSRWDK